MDEFEREMQALPKLSIYVVPDKLLSNLSTQKPLYVDFDTESFQENMKTVASHKVYTPPVWNTFKEGIII